MTLAVVRDLNGTMYYGITSSILRAECLDFQPRVLALKPRERIMSILALAGSFYERRFALPPHKNDDFHSVIVRTYVHMYICIYVYRACVARYAFIRVVLCGATLKEHFRVALP